MYRVYNIAEVQNFRYEIAPIPNPAKKDVTIDIETGEGQEILCTITDISGKQYYSGNFNVTGGCFTKEIDLSAIPPGAYFVTLKNNTLFETKKLIIGK